MACEVSIADERASRKHARLLLAPDGTASIEDLGSRNGTLLNGFPLEAGVATALRAGDRLTLGGSVLVVTEAGVLSAEVRPAIAEPTTVIARAPLARAIHAESLRARRRFVAVNATALPESEPFGIEALLGRGAAWPRSAMRRQRARAPGKARVAATSASAIARPRLPSWANGSSVFENRRAHSVMRSEAGRSTVASGWPGRPPRAVAEEP